MMTWYFTTSCLATAYLAYRNGNARYLIVRDIRGTSFVMTGSGVRVPLAAPVRLNRFKPPERAWRPPQQAK